MGYKSLCICLYLILSLTVICNEKRRFVEFYHHKGYRQFNGYNLFCYLFNFLCAELIQEGRAFGPAFFVFHCAMKLSLFSESPRPCQAENAEAEEQHGGGFGNLLVRCLIFIIGITLDLRPFVKIVSLAIFCVYGYDRLR